MKAETLVAIAISFVVVAQTSGTEPPAAARLVLDATKPLVYIQFDHAGPRKPVEDGEPAEGLWLRLFNNSTLAIIVQANGSETDPSMNILSDVITPRRKRVPKSGINGDKMPAGYASDVGTALIIASGKDVLFSVPSNHVSENWYLQVPFQFDLPPVKQGSQPVCLAGFTWEDIPRKTP